MFLPFVFLLHYSSPFFAAFAFSSLHNTSLYLFFFLVLFLLLLRQWLNWNHLNIVLRLFLVFKMHVCFLPVTEAIMIGRSCTLYLVFS